MFWLLCLLSRRGHIESPEFRQTNKRSDAAMVENADNQNTIELHYYNEVI